MAEFLIFIACVCALALLLEIKRQNVLRDAEKREGSDHDAF